MDLNDNEINELECTFRKLMRNSAVKNKLIRINKENGYLHGKYLKGHSKETRLRTRKLL